MGLLTTIDEIPLYSTVQEAIEWADRNGLNGAHVHKWKNEGYRVEQVMQRPYQGVKITLTHVKILCG